MTDPDVEVLPVGHRARPAAALAVWVSITGAVAFTAFAFITTQMHSVRAGSPWQDDPYDGVVSFTEFLVPALTVLMVARTLLWRRRHPQPVFRISQLLRASVVGTVLVAATVVTDWLAVAARANHPLWNDTTPWLIASLVPLTAVTVAGFLLQRRAFHRLSPRDHRQPDGDWLDDLAALIDMVAVPLPGAVRRLAARFSHGPAIDFVRNHIVAFAAAASLTLSLGITTMQAIGEGWSSPLLFATGTSIGLGGFFAFCMVSNLVLHIAVPRGTVRKRPDAAAGRVRRAARGAVIAGALALPVSAVLRDGIWSALGHHEEVNTVEQLAGLVAGSALLTVVLAFVAMLAITRPRTTTHRPS